MYKVLSKDIIEEEILPYLPIKKGGSNPRVPLTEIINCILYKLKTGMQWHMLPVESLFSKNALHYKSVFYHYRKWCKTGGWQQCWTGYLSENKSKIDLSSADLDGSHTTSLKGGEEVGYQGRKKRKTTNSLYLTERQGLPLSISQPVSGNHHDLYDIENQLDEMISGLRSAEISVDGLFLNADAGFDSQKFRDKCEQNGIIPNVDFNKRNTENGHEYLLDSKLYKERYAIERTNAWMDSFRSLLNRFDFTVSSWLGFNYIAFLILAIKKFRTKT